MNNNHQGSSDEKSIKDPLNKSSESTEQNNPDDSDVEKGREIGETLQSKGYHSQEENIVDSLENYLMTKPSVQFIFDYLKDDIRDIKRDMLKEETILLLIRDEIAKIEREKKKSSSRWKINILFGLIGILLTLIGIIVGILL